MADELAEVPARLAQLFGPGAHPDEIVPTESATRAWETVVWSLAETFGWTSTDRIVVDQFSYATMHSTLAALSVTRGVEVTMAAALDDGSIDPTAVANLLHEPTRRTRLVLVTHTPTHLGTVSDAAAVGRVVAGSDAIYALDVSQTLGQLSLDVDDLGCDLAFAPGRKFLRAPRGTGVLFVRAALAGQLMPLAPPIGSASSAGELTLPIGARRFDQFEFNVAARLGLGVAAGYAAEIGMDRIEALVAARSREVIDVLDAVDGVRLTGTRADRAIISFAHDTLAPDTVQAAVAADGINTWVNPAGGTPLDGARRAVLPSVRVSPHYFTDADDLDRLARALHALPRH